MRILIVCKYKDALPHNMAPFIWEQAEALSEQGITFRFFLVKGRGVRGYLKEISELKKVIKAFKPDIVHAHFGLCGLLANLQRKVPVVTTYHGSDINNPKTRRLSKIAIMLSAHNIFVSKRLVDIAKPKKNYSVIPCGINLDDYPVLDRVEAMRLMNLDLKKKYVLFAGAFDNPVKNPQLAKEAVQLLPGVELLELKGYSRRQVAHLMNAVDCFLMTSHAEGSPQVIKEAMACGCPIVSVDVGDVRCIIGKTEGCFIAGGCAADIAEKIEMTLKFEDCTDGRDKIEQLGLTSARVAKTIIDIYRAQMVMGEHS